MTRRGTYKFELGRDGVPVYEDGLEACLEEQLDLGGRGAFLEMLTLFNALKFPFLSMEHKKASFRYAKVLLPSDITSRLLKSKNSNTRVFSPFIDIEYQEDEVSGVVYDLFSDSEETFAYKENGTKLSITPTSMKDDESRTCYRQIGKRLVEITPPLVSEYDGVVSNLCGDLGFASIIIGYSDDGEEYEYHMASIDSRDHEELRIVYIPVKKLE